MNCYTLYSNENAQSTTPINNVDAPHKYNVEQKRSDTVIVDII